MSDWRSIAESEPQFASRVQGIFESGVNKTIATLRRDGSPRISAIELEFTDGHVQLGMMRRSMKLHDVRRDPRVAIHSPTTERPDGDAKLAGHLVARSPITAEADGAFRLDVLEVVLTYVEGDELVVESWHPDRELEVRRRQ